VIGAAIFWEGEAPPSVIGATEGVDVVLAHPENWNIKIKIKYTLIAFAPMIMV
jgi:hypothetical protein